MKGSVDTVEDYIASLPDDRRDHVKAVRRLVLDNLPDGYVETLNWGMISYEVPLAASGRTYNGKPLMYAAIGNQKNHIGLYLCGVTAFPTAANGSRDRSRRRARSSTWARPACVSDRWTRSTSRRWRTASRPCRHGRWSTHRMPRRARNRGGARPPPR
jgi:hypothetical protein